LVTKHGKNFATPGGALRNLQRCNAVMIRCLEGYSNPEGVAPKKNHKNKNGLCNKHVDLMGFMSFVDIKLITKF
jgi:hypothetical protein